MTRVIFFVIISFFAVNWACPNMTFVMKHVCTKCANTVEDADKFALQAANFRRQHSKRFPKQNSVFIAPSMTYHRQGHLCVFDERAPKYNCLYNKTFEYQWTCLFKGNFIARHDANNGHYYYNDDEYSLGKVVIKMLF